MYLKPILLIEVGKQILVHSLSAQLSLEILLIKLYLGIIYLVDDLLELLEGQSSSRVVVSTDAGVFRHTSRTFYGRSCFDGLIHVPNFLVWSGELMADILRCGLEGLQHSELLGSLPMAQFHNGIR